MRTKGGVVKLMVELNKGKWPDKAYYSPSPPSLPHYLHRLQYLTAFDSADVPGPCTLHLAKHCVTADYCYQVIQTGLLLQCIYYLAPCISSALHLHVPKI